MLKMGDGPAAGQVLMCRSAPEFLRVVREARDGQWDCLDQPHDSPRETERVFVYELVTVPSTVHVRTTKGGGFYARADYKYRKDVKGSEVRTHSDWRQKVEELLHEAKNRREGS